MSNETSTEVLQRLKRMETKMTRAFELMDLDTDNEENEIAVDEEGEVITITRLGVRIGDLMKACKGKKKCDYYVVYNDRAVGVWRNG